MSWGGTWAAVPHCSSRRNIVPGGKEKAGPATGSSGQIIPKGKAWKVEARLRRKGKGSKYKMEIVHFMVNEKNQV